MTASAPSIRPFEPRDLRALQHIRQAAFEPVFRSFRELVGAEIAAIAFTHADAEQAKLLDDICAAGSGHRVLVVTLGEEIVGFASFTIDIDKRTGEIGFERRASGPCGQRPRNLDVRACHGAHEGTRHGARHSRHRQ